MHEPKENPGYETVYSNPSLFGLEIVGSIEMGASYEFDTFIVFRDLETQKLYWLHDAGCSCPIPFENKTIRDLIPLETSHDLYDALSKAFPHEKPSFESVERLVVKCAFKKTRIVKAIPESRNALFENFAKSLVFELRNGQPASALEKAISNITRALTETDTEAYRRGWNEGIEKCVGIIEFIDEPLNGDAMRFLRVKIHEMRTFKLPAEKESE